MFGLGKKKTKTKDEATDKSPLANPLIEAEVKTEEIRTMPDKFLTRHGRDGKKDHWLIYIIILVVVALLILAAIFLFNRIIKTNDNTNTVNQNANTANQNTNTVNQNANTNANTNLEKYEELTDVLLNKADLGQAYEKYQESDASLDSTTESEVAVDLARKYITYEETDKNNIIITVSAYETNSASDALAVFEAKKEEKNQLVKQDEGDFNNHDAVGDDSYLYVNKEVSLIELGFYWEYVYGSIKIEIRQGVLTKWNEIEDWADKFLVRIKKYNTDRPTPTNKNQNVNINTNANSNTNLNQNVNVNTNANININPPVGSDDDDGDDLTNTEEVMYGTDPAKPDTDGDSYLDGAELIGGYNPLAAGGARLEVSGLVKVFDSQLYNYRVLYPTTWLVRNAMADGSNVTFSADTSEFVEIIVEDNPDRLSPKQWYLTYSPSIDPTAIDEIVIGSLVGVRSLDQMTYYLGKENVIYIITYNIGNRTEASFLSTFQMMVKNFTLTDVPKGPGTDSNVNSNTNANSNTNSNLNANTNTQTNSEANSDSSPIAGPALLNNESVDPNLR
ncbi:MAG: hypothetical protein PHH01_04460 [Patescibacteria group bacterium]|nr:hypothetical protein [Patescibacteria group bacterium]